MWLRPADIAVRRGFPHRDVRGGLGHTTFETARGSLSRRSAQQCSKSRQAGAQQMQPHTPRHRGTYRVPQQQPHRRHASPRHAGLPPTTPGVDSATTARPTGHVHTCQNDPTTCPAHHMSQMPCTGSQTGLRELRVGGVGTASLRKGGSGEKRGAS